VGFITSRICDLPTCRPEVARPVNTSVYHGLLELGTVASVTGSPLEEPLAAVDFGLCGRLTRTEDGSPGSITLFDGMHAHYGARKTITP
jgi:hypothetical protein